jgi:hypothetical protein
LRLSAIALLPLATASAAVLARLARLASLASILATPAPIATARGLPLFAAVGSCLISGNCAVLDVGLFRGLGFHGRIGDCHRAGRRFEHALLFDHCVFSVIGQTETLPGFALFGCVVDLWIEA